MSAVEETYQRLRQMLVTGDFPPGTRLKELDLVASLGVSRTPLREAFRVLEGDGLVTLSGRGAIVASSTPAEILDLYAYRAVLEGFVAESVAQRSADGDLAPSQIKRLWTLVDEVEAADSSSQRVEANVGLHSFIAQLSGNVPAANALDRVWAQISIASATNFDDPCWRAEVPIQHRAIAQAIESGDPETAFAVARRHVKDAADVFRRRAGNETTT